MRGNFDIWLSFCWRPENDGQPDHVDAGDPGGETNHAVTIGTWNEQVRHGLVTGALATASRYDLRSVLRAAVWSAVAGDALPAGVDVMVADMACLGGAARAAKLLQRCIGVDDDGDIGPLTLAAAAGADAIGLVDRLQSADDEYFEGLRTFRLFGQGWERRIRDCGALAVSIVPPRAP